MSSTAQPWSRFSTMRSWMNSVAPMSTPRVGWHTSSTGDPKENSRASTTFCMLPPLRDPAGSSTPEVRISKVRVSSCAYFFTCPRLRWIPRRLNAGVRCLPTIRFSATLAFTSMPVEMRSSGI